MSTELVQPAEPITPVNGLEIEGPPQPASATILPSGPGPVFGPPPPTQVCSLNECVNGHKWPPSFALAKCPGCQAPVLAVRMEQCPVCNEPVRKLSMRVDHSLMIEPAAGRAAPTAPACQGIAGLNEVTLVEMERQHAAETEASHVQRVIPCKL